MFGFGKHFSDEYRWATSMANPHWRMTRLITMGLSFGRDCVFPLLPAQQVDHLTYRHMGRELPWIDVVPLHAGTHAIVTALRDGGLAFLVNPILRIAYGLWLLPWLFVLAELLYHVGLSPIAPLNTARSAIGAVSHLPSLLAGIPRGLHLPVGSR